MKYRASTGGLRLTILSTVMALLCPFGLMAQASQCQLQVAGDVGELSGGEGLSLQVLEIDSKALLRQSPSQSTTGIVAKSRSGYLLRFADARQGEWRQSVFPNKRALESRLKCADIEAIRKWGEHERRISRNILAWVSEGLNGSSLGEDLIQTEQHHLWAKSLGLKGLSPLLEKYRKLLGEVEATQVASKDGESFFLRWRDVKEKVYSEKKAGIGYCYDQALILSALDDNCTNCQGLTGLFISLFIDAKMKAPQGWTLRVESFRDHVRPVLYNINEDRIFDLTNGKIEKRKSAIYDWKVYLYGLIKGSSLPFNAREKKELSQVDTDPIYLSWLCRFRPTPTDSFESQMLDPKVIKACEFYGSGRPPQERIDLSALIDIPSSSYSEEGMDSSELLKRPKLEGEGTPRFIDTYIFLLGEYCNKQCSQKLIQGARPDLNRLLGIIGEGDMQAIKKAAQYEPNSAQELQAQFSKVMLWEKMGLTPQLGPLAKELFENAQESASCFWLTPLTVTFDTTRTNTFEYSDGRFYSNDSRHTERFFELDTRSRYLTLAEQIRLQIRENLAVVRETYQGELPQIILKQHKNAAKIRGLLKSIEAYGALMDRSFSGCISSEEQKDLVSGLFRLDVFQAHLRPIIEYRARVSSEPIAYIESMMSVLDAHSKVTELDPLFGKDHWRLLNTLRGTGAMWEGESFYQGVIDYLLTNPNFYFVPPSEDSKPRLDIKEAIKKSFQSTFNAEPDLPQLDVEECRADESGYVQRGLLFIYCDPSMDQKDSEQKLVYSAFDPRPEVVIGAKYWASLFALFGAKDFENNRLYLHHLYRPSISEIYKGPRHLLDIEMMYRGLRVSNEQVDEVNQSISDKKLSYEQALGQLITYAEDSIDKSGQAPFSTKLEILARKEALSRLKQAWHYLITVDGSGDEFHSPVLWIDIEQQYPAPACIESYANLNMFIACIEGISASRVKYMLEVSAEKNQSTGLIQWKQ